MGVLRAKKMAERLHRPRLLTIACFIVNGILPNVAITMAARVQLRVGYPAAPARGQFHFPAAWEEVAPGQAVAEEEGGETKATGTKIIVAKQMGN